MRAFLFLSLTISLFADEFPKPFNTGTDVGKKPMSADEAVKLIKMPEGFKATVFAAEPDVQNPIACAWDSRGRLWVAENYSYAEAAVGFDKRLRDRIVIFEDTDNDGKHDKRTVFADNLFNLTSIELGYGGVYATAAPYLLWIPDEDRDDKPDAAVSPDKLYSAYPSYENTSTRILLDGFDDKSVRHNFVNGLRWGPDGWLYGRHGILATSKVGKPGTPDAERLGINVGIWRWHPTRHTVEMVTYGGTNPWGLDFNAEGEGFFTNTVTGHLYHMIPGAHYERMYGEDPNPYIYQLLPQTADHYHYDRSKNWTASRDGAANDFGGGHAHVGCMIYHGENWPAQYRGKLFTINLHGRRINVNRLELKGSGYVGKSEPDMIFFGDPWFRGNELTYGPDGGVYVLDWSDQGECHENDGVHRESGRIYKITFGEVKKNVASENVTPTTKAAAAAFVEKGDLALLSDEQLVSSTIEGTEWISRTARRLLSERAFSESEKNSDRELVISNLITEAYQQASLPNRQRSLFALHAITFGTNRTGSASISGSPHKITGRGAAIRAWFHEKLIFGPNEEKRLAVRLLPEWWGGDSDEDIVKAIEDVLKNRITVKDRTNESDIAINIGAFIGLAALGEPQNSLAVASSIRQMPQKTRWLAISGFDAKPEQVDLLVRSVAWAGLMAPNRFQSIDTFQDPLVQPTLAALEVETSKLPEIVSFSARFVAENCLNGSETNREKRGKVMGLLLRGATKAGNEATISSVTSAFAASLKGAYKLEQPKDWPAFADKAAKFPALADKLRELNVIFGDGRALDEIRVLALDSKAEIPARKQAVESLIAAKPADLRVTLEKLVAEDRELMGAALRGMAVFEDAGPFIATNYQRLYREQRAMIVPVMCSRPAFALALLDAVAAGKIARSDITPYHARQIAGLADDAVNKRLAEIWGSVATTSDQKKKRMAELKAALTPEVLAKADIEKGRAVYTQTCAACHTLFDLGQTGANLGPNLTGSGRGDINYLLENIIDPSAIVPADYKLSTVTLKDGRVLSGFISSQNAQTMTLRTMTETQTLDRTTVAKTEASAQSLMPEGILDALTPDQIRDLFGFLMRK